MARTCEDKRKTVANLVVDTWAENSQALHLLPLAMS
jgi:hypothetical protein